MYSTLPSILYNDQLFAVRSSYECFPFNVIRTRDLQTSLGLLLFESRVGQCGRDSSVQHSKFESSSFSQTANQLISLEAELLAYSDLKFSSLSLSIFPGGPKGCLTGCITVAG